MKGASGVESVVDVLIPHIFQDITPEKEAVLLKVPNNYNKFIFLILAM